MDLDPFQALDNVPATPVVDHSAQESTSSNNKDTTTTRSADQTTSDDLAFAFIGTVTEADVTALIAKDISTDRSSISSFSTPSRMASSSTATPSKSSSKSGPVGESSYTAIALCFHIY